MAYDAPYYLSGDARVRWHKKQAKKSFSRGVVAGGAAGLMLHPKTGESVGRLAAEQLGRRSMQLGVDGHTAQQITGAAYKNRRYGGYTAGALSVQQLASGGIHTYKAKKYEKAYTARKKRSKVATFHETHAMSGTGASGSAYYTRQVNGKTQRVRKGR